jgi:alpha-1,2-glucosyltransferase
LSIFRVIPVLLKEFIPYGILSALFVSFVVWNGGIVLGKQDLDISDRTRPILSLGLIKILYCTGDKSNHIPALHIPQLFYFYAFSSVFGWPVLLFSGTGSMAGPVGLFKELIRRMAGDARYVYLVPKSFATNDPIGIDEWCCPYFGVS